MYTFAQLFTMLMEKRKITAYSLAKLSEVNRTEIQKIKAGTRVPKDQTTLDKLAKALSLTPMEYYQLLEVYYQARMGNLVYSRRRLIRNILSGFYVQHEPSAQIDFTSESQVHLKMPCTIVKGQTQVNQLVKAVLEEEICQKNGHIYIAAQPDFTYLYSLLTTLNFSQTQTQLESWIYFNGSGETGTLTDLKTFNRLVPLLFAQDCYTPYYVHGDTLSLFNTNTLFPYQILTAHFSLHISYDTKHAFVSNDPEFLALMKVHFQKLRAVSEKLFISTNTAPEDYFNTLAPLMDFKSDNLNIMYQPCLIPFCPTKILYNTVNPKLIDKMWGKIDTYVHQMQSYAPHMVQNFSLSGIKQFLATGWIIEIPHFMMNGPLPPSARLAILKHFILAIQGNNVPAHCLREDLFSIPPQVMLTAYSPSKIVIHYYRKDGRVFLLQPKEAGLTDSFLDFLEWFPKSHLVYNREETLYQLQGLYNQYMHIM